MKTKPGSDAKTEAQLAPSQETDQPAPKFATGKGKVKLIDPHCFEPMTDEEVEAFIEGRY